MAARDPVELRLDDRELGAGRPGVGFDLDRPPTVAHGLEAALDVVARGEVSPGLVAPRVLLDRPFPRERPDKRFDLDDGLLLLLDD